MCRDLLKQGERIAAIVATMGTTDAFGLDDLSESVAIRDRLVDEFSLDYLPHLHADAVIGWAWSVFNDYDFGENPLGFRGRTVRALAGAQRRMQHLRLADSIGIDFHKTGFTPYISSLFLVRDTDDLSLISPQRRIDAVSVSSRASTIPASSRWKRRAAAAGRWRPWPICCCSARTGCGRCWGTWCRWPKRCANSSKRTRPRTCSTATTSGR